MPSITDMRCEIYSVDIFYSELLPQSNLLSPIIIVVYLPTIFRHVVNHHCHFYDDFLKICAPHIILFTFLFTCKFIH